MKETIMNAKEMQTKNSKEGIVKIYWSNKQIV